ncbi:FAD-dependent oxidoreductase [Pseudomonas sp. XWY-1]|uniref:NAD(P)/FAD-dependent oxidoreductase n=1 Tax=Pseudomonas sp. XWY-1 TaxID=2069256 RepID=UPI000CF4D78A
MNKFWHPYCCKVNYHFSPRCFAMEIPRPIPANLESQQAWWQYDIETARGQPSPAFKGGARYDVVVIGGGFTGLWTALTLKQRRPQLQVAVLEAFRVGDGASTRNGGIVHGYWQSLASNVKTLGVDAALDLAYLGSRAQDAFRAYASACDNDVDWREAGNLRVSTCPAQERQLAVHRRDHAGWRDPAELHDHGDLPVLQRLAEIRANPEQRPGRSYCRRQAGHHRRTWSGGHPRPGCHRPLPLGRMQSAVISHR